MVIKLLNISIVSSINKIQRKIYSYCTVNRTEMEFGDKNAVEPCMIKSYLMLLYLDLRV